MAQETVHDRTFEFDQEEIRKLCGLGESGWKITFITAAAKSERITVRFTRETGRYTVAELAELQEFITQEQAGAQEREQRETEKHQQYLENRENLMRML
jgi:hypothetical protein